MATIGTGGGPITPRLCSPLPIEAVPAVRDPGRVFACPACQRRWVRTLYEVDGQLACRVCHHLDYASRHEGRDPARAAVRARRKLGGSGDLLEPVPQPKAGDRQQAKLYRDLVISEERAVLHAQAFVRNLGGLRGKL